MTRVTTRDAFLREFPASLADESAGLFVGAGVSMGAGYPSWKELLQDIGEELGVDSADVSDLAALAQWHIRRSAGATKIRQVIRNEIAVERAIPEILDVVARLPLRHIWTTNYDRLIERAFAQINRPMDVISAVDDLALKPRAGASRLYKMHGTVDRLNDLVISTDDYELFHKKRGAFLPLLQAHLSSLSMLFVGLSFTDPNVRHVLSVIREAFTEAPPEHFAIIRPPQRKEFKTDASYEARLTQHKLWSEDLLRYGLRAVEIDSYEEVPALLKEVERKIASKRVWVSGSLPITSDNAEFVHEIANGLGRAIGKAGLTMVSGAGVLVGSASLSGFISALQATGSWDLDRRLIARPFPQPLEGKEPDRAQWELLRVELARLAGITIFVGGSKVVDGTEIISNGVQRECELAKISGSFLLPIGATGGAAKVISMDLVGSDIALQQRPSDEELVALTDSSRSVNELCEIAMGIIMRASDSKQF